MGAETARRKEGYFPVQGLPKSRSFPEEARRFDMAGWLADDADWARTRHARWLLLSANPSYPPPRNRLCFGSVTSQPRRRPTDHADHEIAHAPTWTKRDMSLLVKKGAEKRCDGSHHIRIIFPVTRSVPDASKKPSFCVGGYHKVFRKDAGTEISNKASSSSAARRLHRDPKVRCATVTETEKKYYFLFFFIFFRCLRTRRGSQRADCLFRSCLKSRWSLPKTKFPRAGNSAKI
jgi:hypothetical protein